MIDRHLGISSFFATAQNYLSTQTTFTSPIERNLYCVVAVHSNSVVIRRLSVSPQTEVSVSEDLVTQYIDLINSLGNIERNTLRHAVAKETAIVELLPMLDWDNERDFIVEALNFSQAPIHSIIEATNDNIYQQIERRLRARRGQNKLRDNLMYVYQNRCCVTDCNIEEILHACHIEPHNISGNNHTTNAFLMRSDIHDLFDSNLIGIHPETLVVSLSSKLANTSYSYLNGKKINERIDNVRPNKDALQERWQMFQNSQNN